MCWYVVEDGFWAFECPLSADNLSSAASDIQVSCSGNYPVIWNKNLKEYHAVESEKQDEEPLQTLPPSVVMFDVQMFSWYLVVSKFSMNVVKAWETGK